MVEQPRYLRVAEVARRLDVTEWTVRNWLRSGHIKGARPGGTRAGWRIPESEVDRLLRGEPSRDQAGDA